MSLSQEKRPAPRPTLEDLLQLKRSERPPAEFWDAFNRGLREKQLAALVHQPRGWERLKPLFARSLRWSVPATAAALAVFGLVRHVGQAPGLVQQPVNAPAATVAVVNSTPAISAPRIVDSSLPPEITPANDPLARIPNERAIPAIVLAEAREGISVRELNTPAQPAAATSRPASTPLAVVAHAAADVLQQPMEFVQSRFNATADLGQQMARSVGQDESSPVTSWGEIDSRLLQVTALDLRVSNEHAGNLMSTPVSYSAQPKHQVRLPDDEREYRDAVSRVGVQGSSLSIRF